MTGALAWIEGPPDVWTAEIEDTCRYPDDDDPGAFLVSIRSDEDGLMTTTAPMLRFPNHDEHPAIPLLKIPPDYSTSGA